MEERIQYYMGDWYNSEIIIDQKVIEEFPEILPRWHDLTFLYHSKILQNFPIISYIEDINNIMKKFNINDVENRFIIQLGDLPSYYPNLPVIMNHRELRLIEEKSKDKSILFKLNRLRHWCSFDEIDRHDVPWDKKHNCVVWRGITTGYEENPPRLRLCENYSEDIFISNKFKFLKKILLKISKKISILSQNVPFKIIKKIGTLLNNKLGKYIVFNIGFNGSCQNIYEGSKYIKGFMSIESQLKYKYIISIQGNDVATNLKWTLYSNSLVLMPKPTVESWLMEGLLEPYVHYVPLNAEMDDLNDVYNWCINNDEKCKEIARNSTSYMKQFMDVEQEDQIMLRMLEKYIKNVKIRNNSK